MQKLIDIGSYPVANALDILLQDKSTKKNIIWATDTYEQLGEGFTDKVQIDAAALRCRPDIIRPRIQKSLEEQSQRTRKKAEVFTPAWLCNRMNNYCDEDWFGRPDVFNTENENHTWTAAEGKTEFPKRRRWQQYVDSRRLEITCGEAPYLVSRYDVSTGEAIEDPLQRMGILDRKLRVVNENTESYEDWLKWTVRAFEASYGYEYQGDNVLIARINLLLTFTEHYERRWNRLPDDRLLKQIANIAAWNIWQMDGLKGTVPLGKPYEEFKQLSFFEAVGFEEVGENEPEAVPCRIHDWRGKTALRFMDIKEMRDMGKKLFDYVIGNPPYQETMEGTSDRPVYNLFMDEAYSVSDKVEIISPARFLFNAGKTPKAWNEKMLADEHFKVLRYEQVSGIVFANTDIMGGVAITYRDSTQNFGAVGTFTTFSELNGILHKVTGRSDFKTFSNLVYAPESYKFSQKLHDELPDIKEKLSQGHLFDVTSNIFDKLDEIVFFEKKPEEGEAYIQMYGRYQNERVYRWIKRKYINSHDNLDYYKIFVPKSNGSGALGVVLVTPVIGQPVIGQPVIGHTQTFISIGKFTTKEEAEAVLKYVKSKFLRTLLGVLKITQDNKKAVWKYVPLQDFTPNSDIDWSKSVHEIDLQLYRKYGLTEDEIEFIESHVKEMA